MTRTDIRTELTAIMDRRIDALHLAWRRREAGDHEAADEALADAVRLDEEAVALCARAKATWEG